MSFTKVNKLILRDFLITTLEHIVDIREQIDKQTISGLLGKRIKKYFKKDDILDTEEKVIKYLDDLSSEDIFYTDWRSNKYYNKHQKSLQLLELIEATDKKYDYIYLSLEDNNIIRFKG